MGVYASLLALTLTSRFARKDKEGEGVGQISTEATL